MDALTLTAACVLCITQPSTPPTIARWEPLIEEASARFNVPESWIVGVMRVESDGQTTLNGEPITSSAGAMGLMQIMPHTYAALQKQYRLGDDPYDPHDNIWAGTAYLKAMYLRYGYPLLFAAYLTGPAHLDRYLFSSGCLPPNVIAYVNGIVPGAISVQEADSKQPELHSPTAKIPRSSDLFFILKSVPEPPQPNQNQVPETPASELKSVFVGAGRSANLFISSPSRNH